MNKSARTLSNDVSEIILVVILLLVLLVALYDVLHIFFGIFTFALIFSVSFSNIFEKFVLLLNNRRKPAAFIYSFILIIIIGIPVGFLFSTVIRNIKHTLIFIDDVRKNGPPPLPLWIAHLPFVGEQAAELWTQYQSNPKELFMLHQTQVKGLLQHVMKSGFGLLGTVLQLVIGIIVSSLFLVNKEKVLQPVKLTLQHLLGERSGLSLMEATAMSIKGVSAGVMGTAFIAAIISWIGLMIAGIPFALGLSAAVFFLVLLQIGPFLVWIPLVIWMSTQDHPGMLIFIIAWGIFIVIIDNVLKPILIGRSGGKIPFLVLVIGVFGGIAEWGFTGMFKGAIIMAVFYTVFYSWLEKKNVKTQDDVATT